MRHPGVGVARGHDCRDDGVQGFQIAGALGHGAEAVIVHDFGAADRAEEFAPLPVGQHHHAEKAVAGLERPPYGRVAVEYRRADRRLEAEAGHMVGQHQRGDRLEHRDFDVLAGARAGAVVQRAQHRVGRQDAGDPVGQGDGGVARRIAVGAQRRDARGGLDQIVIGRLVGMGSRAAVADDVQVHQRGVERGDIRIGQPQARHGLGAGIADEYVGRAGQAPERVASAFQIEVQHDAALAAVGVQEHGAHAAMPGRAQVADAVALGRLDLDHLGAHVPRIWVATGPDSAAVMSSTRTPLNGPSIPLPLSGCLSRFRPG